MAIKNMQVPRVKIYQFGSSLSSDVPNDLDILIIYKILNLNEIEDVIIFKNNLKKKIEKTLLIPLDIILLSESEALQLNYLNKITYQRIF